MVIPAETDRACRPQGVNSNFKSNWGPASYYLRIPMEDNANCGAVTAREDYDLCALGLLEGPDAEQI